MKKLIYQKGQDDFFYPYTIKADTSSYHYPFLSSHPANNHESQNYLIGNVYL